MLQQVRSSSCANLGCRDLSYLDGELGFVGEMNCSELARRCLFLVFSVEASSSCRQAALCIYHKTRLSNVSDPNLPKAGKPISLRLILLVAR